jgi:hypothetical protein
LRIEMGMEIDEARGDGQPARVDYFAPAAEVAVDRRYSAVIDREVGGEGLGARAVNDSAAFDYDFV